MLVVVGMHYKPFVFLYGMAAFAALSGLLVVAGVAIGLYVSQTFSLGGWIGGLLLLLFAFVLKGAAETSRS